MDTFHFDYRTDRVVLFVNPGHRSVAFSFGNLNGRCSTRCRLGAICFIYAGPRDSDMRLDAFEHTSNLNII